MTHSNQPLTQQETRYIGNVWMEKNGDILLQLFINEDNGMKGQALFRHKPDTEEFNNILQHIGGLEPGEKKGVLPWPETK